MTYSEFQNAAEDGAERHQVEVSSGLAKMYAEGRGIFFDVEGALEGQADVNAQLAESSREIYR